MPKETRYRNRVELLQGTLDLLASERSRWEQLSEAIARALNPQVEGGEA